MTLADQYDKFLDAIKEFGQSEQMEKAIHEQINQFFGLAHPETVELIEDRELPVFEENETKQRLEYKDKPAVMLMDQDGQVFQYICFGNVIGKAVLGFQGSCRMSLDKVDGSILEVLIRKDGTVTQL